MNANEVVSFGARTFGDELAVASSFGAEDVVLIDMAVQAGITRVFTLDTAFLFPETYALMERIESRYGIVIERCRPQREGAQGLWATQPDACCNIRKVEPLAAKLAELKAWVTGIRREQAPTRAHAQKIEWDARFGLFKLNPLVDWSWSDVWNYVHEHRVPYNPLHDAGYPSIGCTHCTRPVAAGEDMRAGRWSGTGKIECGLHQAR